MLTLNSCRIGSHLTCALADRKSGRDDALVQLKSEPLELLGDLPSLGCHIPLLMSDVNEGLLCIKDIF